MRPVLIWTVAVLLIVNPMLATSQQSQPQPQLNKVIQDVLKAESAGASPEEIGKLTVELNSVIDLEDQLQNLSPQEADKRLKLLGEISNTLARVDTEGNKIEITATQRTFTNHLITYSIAGIGAILATIGCHYTLSLWRRYRAKRALQLKIVPK